ncbi:MAG: trypsin-like peptidase domain-containing protein [Magnetococcales bacterium]|nr:trypsin-like peptidase domain-containing protein [Nitrospirota bacterium]
MKSVSRGQRLKLSTVTTDDDVTIRIGWGSNCRLIFDVCCLALDTHEKLLNEKYFIFYNQMESPCKGIIFDNANAGYKDFSVSFKRLSEDVRKLMFVQTIDGEGLMSQLSGAYTQVLSSVGPLLSYEYPGSDFSCERSIITCEIYVTDQWRFSAMGQGFSGGFSEILKFYAPDIDIDTAGTDAASGQTQRRPLAPKELFNQVVDAVVLLKTNDGNGSGFFVAPDGLIVTNRHVVVNDVSINVRLYNKKEFRGKVIYHFKDSDIAFVKIDAVSPGTVTTAQLHRHKLEVGDRVYAIGNPAGLSFTFTDGLISDVSREINRRRYIQTNAAINPGNSGGPLFNEYGEVIGINTSGIRGMQGLNFAIPADILQEKIKRVRGLMGNMSERYFAIFVAS